MNPKKMEVAMNKMSLFLFAVFALLVTTTVGASGPETPLRFGWVIGNTRAEGGGAGSVSILHTRNGGLKWTEQLERSEWAGFGGNDISAVDRLTAWAALNSPDGDGVILHTTNGGSTWTAQALPDGVDEIKNIKGLSRQEAWAVSLKGTILHTTDGGETWNIVEHSSVPIERVNRMDVIGCVDPHIAVKPGKNRLMSNANIWIVDEFPEDQASGMIHSLYTLYNGQLWRQENVPNPPDNGMHMVSAYSPRVVWAATTLYSFLYRTLDGGESWEEVADVKGGPNDLDDMCAVSSDTVWVVQNLSGNQGAIRHARVFDAGEPVIRDFDPVSGYAYEGLTCVDDQTALAVGQNFEDPSYPAGVIVSTTDGGDSWTRHSIPFSDVGFWKTSFVGARR
jgi:photosystem II stability/assembly factor-like uncharacterized protein